MYVAEKFVKQIENHIEAPGLAKFEKVVNKKALNWAVRNLSDKDEWANAFITCVNFSYSKDEAHRALMILYRKFVTDVGVGLDYDNFVYTIKFYLIHIAWQKRRKIYDVNDELSRQLAYVKHPDMIDREVLLQMPEQLFYIKFGTNQEFAPNFDGMFVMSTYLRDSAIILHFILLRDRETISTSDFSVLLKETVKQFDVNMSRYNKDEVQVLNGVEYKHNAGKLFDFYVNLCLYMKSVNSDVEIISCKTSKNQKGRKGVPVQPRPSEVRVGYHYAATISANRKVYRHADKAERSASGERRAYKSCYRSAHWHTYWVNDTTVKGKKKKIIKWIPEVFVNGSYEDLSVTIQRVTK